MRCERLSLWEISLSMRFVLALLLPFFLSAPLAAQNRDSLWFAAVWDRVTSTCSSGDRAGAEQMAKLALDTARQQYGPESKMTANVLDALGFVYQTTGDNKSLEVVTDSSLAIRRKVLGPKTREVVATMTLLATARFRLGKYDSLEAMLLEGKQILTDLGLTVSQEMEDLLITYAMFEESQGYFLKAEPMHLEALRIETTMFGDKRFEYGTCVNNLGVFYATVNRPDEAIYYYDLALKNRGNLKPDNPEYLLTVKNKGTALVRAGRYREAEAILMPTLATARKVFPPNSAELVTYLTGPSNLYRLIGRTDDAIRLGKEMLDIYKKQLGEAHPRYHSALLSLAVLLCDSGYAEGDTLLQEALRVMEESHRENTLNYANALVQQSRNYRRAHRYPEARIALEKAASIGEKISGKDDPTFHWFFTIRLVEQNLAENKPDEALRLLDQAGAVLLKSFGPYHARTIMVESFYGRSWQLRGNAAEALKHFQNAFEGLRQNFSENFAFLSITERENFARSYTAYQADFLAFARNFPNDPAVQSFSFDLALFYKELLASYDRQLLADWQQNRDSTYQHYVAVRQMLAGQLALPVNKRLDLTSLENEKEALEKTLVGSSKSIADGSMHGAAHWQSIQQALQPGDAAIEWLNLPPALPDAGKDCYGALLLRPGTAAPELILFPEVRYIDSLFASRGTRGLQYATRTYQGTALYKALWEPMLAKLKGVKRIFYAPTGPLHLLNFDAIPTPDGALLGEKYQLVLVSNTARLLDADFGQNLTATSQALLVGGLDYDLAPASTEVTASSPPPMSETLWRGADPGARKNWTKLPQTLAEVEQLGALLQQKKIRTSVLTEAGGSEAVIKSRCMGQDAPGILHFATHGFFFEKPKQGAGESGGMSMAESPMYRSGLILSGANPAWRGDSTAASANGNDGILTAEEVSLFNLRKTDLVVLSACETGLGDVRDDEGVYGLQRAFRLAGARNIVMSLWRVPDTATRIFMEHFYAALLEKGAVREAFHKARQEMRKEYGSPYYWAGFVLME